MKIILAAIEPPLAEAFQRHCGDLENVSIHQGSILDLNVDAIVSPANSYGFMDGGIDFLYSKHFGWEVQEKLQELIRAKHHGELLVGQAEIVETREASIPFVIAAPTMRVPVILQESVNPYLAARAVFLLIRHGTFWGGALEGTKISQAVQSVAIPGLGTGVGRVEPEICARQIRRAIVDVVEQQYQFPQTWVKAQVKHQLLYSDHFRDLQHPG